MRHFAASIYIDVPIPLPTTLNCCSDRCKSVGPSAPIAYATYVSPPDVACGIRGFGFDAQPCRKVGFSQVERLFEETACLLRQSGTALCRSELSACGIDA